VPLDKDQIAAVSISRRVPEMAEADIIEGRGRLEAGDVPAKLRAFLVGTQNDCECIPANKGAQLVLDRSITG
jgi:hypothetical protein